MAAQKSGDCKRRFEKEKFIQIDHGDKTHAPSQLALTRALDITQETSNTERAFSNGKTIGMALDVPGLHLLSGGQLPGQHGKLGYGDLDEASDSVADKMFTRKPAQFSSLLPDPQELIEIKNKKKLLITGTEQFIQKPKKGIEFLQKEGLLALSMDNTEVTQGL